MIIFVGEEEKLSKSKKGKEGYFFFILSSHRALVKYPLFYYSRQKNI